MNNIQWNKFFYHLSGPLNSWSKHKWKAHFSLDVISYFVYRSRVNESHSSTIGHGTQIYTRLVHLSRNFLKKTRIFLKKKSSSLKEKKTSRNGSFFLFFLLLLFLLLLLLFLCFYFSETGQDSSTQSLKNRQPTRPPPFPQMTWRTRERAGGKPGRSFKYSVVKLIKNGQKKKHWNWEPSPIRTSALRTLCKNHVFFKNIFEADPFLLERPQTNSETQ